MIDEILNTPSSSLSPLWVDKSTNEALVDIRRGYGLRSDICTVLITDKDQEYLIIISSVPGSSQMSDNTFRYINTELNLDFVDISLEDVNEYLMMYMI